MKTTVAFLFKACLYSWAVNFKCCIYFHEVSEDPLVLHVKTSPLSTQCEKYFSRRFDEMHKFITVPAIVEFKLYEINLSCSLSWSPPRNIYISLYDCDVLANIYICINKFPRVFFTLFFLFKEISSIPYILKKIRNNSSRRHL